MAYSGRTRPTPARRRKSALQPVGPGQSQQPTTAEEWIAVPVPAIINQETFEAAQSRLDRNVQMARRQRCVTSSRSLNANKLDCSIYTWER